jgi:hypothetical protein
MTGSPGKPHRLNVPGAFYVVDQCCTSCGVPEMLAKENFSSHPDGHCYVSRQPESESELESVLEVVVSQELGCVRYAGSSIRILQRLADAQEAAQCDNPLRIPIHGVHRTYSTFKVRSDARPELGAVLSGLRTRLLQSRPTFRATEIITKHPRASFSLAWFQDDFHLIELTESPGQPGSFLLHHGGPLGLASMIDEAIRACEYDDVQWTPSPSGEQGSPHPW